ncbi:HsdM family class I SAM-dependent methyltransferase [Corynebacterium nasicanis]
MTLVACDPLDTSELRKARGAFFTPTDVALFLAEWAVRHPGDRVLEPSTGDAELLVSAVGRLRELGAVDPRVWGSELHASSAQVGVERIVEAGGVGEIEVQDFFNREVAEPFDVVIGNPPYIRFQSFTGPERARAREAALSAGVALSGLASAWAAFTVRGAQHLAPGGRLAFVLPSELLTANYGGPVREYLIQNFADIEIILFDERIFADVDTDALLLLASGYGCGPAAELSFRRIHNAASLDRLPPAVSWTPADPAGKWSAATVSAEVTSTVLDLQEEGSLVPLLDWGQTKLGAVTGRNTFFALTLEDVENARLRRDEVLPLSPPGSAHLRGLELSAAALRELGAQGKRTSLFYPTEHKLSAGAEAYIADGEGQGVSGAYKCRVRRLWWQVPLSKPADLFLTYMNADTARLVTNSAGAYHLNSVHGVYLRPECRKLGRGYLPLAALNSMTLLSAETTGRAYGGGVLKIEPGEANRWLVPSIGSIDRAKDALSAIRPLVGSKLGRKDLGAAVKLVDEVVLVESLGISRKTVREARDARNELAYRREVRSRGIRN